MNVSKWVVDGRKVLVILAVSIFFLRLTVIFFTLAYIGNPGSQGVSGFDGKKGEKGDIGESGNPGRDGSPGVPGEVFYALNTGKIGSKGIDHEFSLPFYLHMSPVFSKLV